MNTQKAWVLERPGSFRLEERPVAEPGPGEVRVKVHTVSICGSDVHAIRGDMPLFRFPRVIGHEVSGRVDALGEGVTEFRRGDPVCLTPCISCGECLACRHGAGNACKTLRLYGVHEDGGLQEYLTVPAQNLLCLPGGIPLELASLIEPFTIGMHAVRKLGLGPGDRVLTLGAGPIGVCCAQIARSLGAEAYCADLSPERRRFVSQRFGLTVLDPLCGDYARQLDEITEGEGFYGLVDTTANKQSMDHAYERIGSGGRIVFVGILRGTLEMDGQAFHMKEPSLFTSRNSTREDYRDVISLMEQGLLNASDMVTHRAAFDQADQALLWQSQNPAEAFKQLVCLAGAPSSDR